MIKKFMTMALVALTLSASTAFAQTAAADGQTEPTRKEMRLKGDKKDKKDRKDMKDRKDRKDKKGGKDFKGNRPCKGDSACAPGQCALRQFEGLNLSAEQKTQLQALQQQQFEARKAKMEAFKAQKDANKADKAARKEMKQKKDSAGFAERKAAKLEYLSKVKGILTPTQYIDFLENYYVNSQQSPKGMKPGKNGMKPEKGQKPGKGFKGGKDFKGGKEMKGNN